MRAFILFFILALAVAPGQSQERFSAEAYYKFLDEHKDMPYSDLLNLYPVGLFERYSKTDLSNVMYLDSIISKFKIKDGEKQLLSSHSFFVADRFQYNNFIRAFGDVFNKDLPYYFSSDALLHAFHRAYDEILITIESCSLKYRLSEATRKLYTSAKSLEGLSSSDIYQKALRDYDLYYSVASTLLNGTSNPFYQENKNRYYFILSAIRAEQPDSLPLFGESRLYDYSQFTLRGHYADHDNNLESYFQGMMWLGRTEMKISSGNGYCESEHRQAIVAAMVANVAKSTRAIDNLNFIDDILTKFVAPSDNINIREIISALDKLNIKDAGELADSTRYETFKAELLTLKSANQLYNSQILFSDPFDTVQIKTPSVFMVIGQRPILDGFITANVVYDKIIHKDNKVTRMLPSTQDILFALGNDASAQLLQSELEKYNYSDNLSALRYLVDGYDIYFWNSSVYTNWLKAIRSLNPPKDRSGLPAFMQTAAWWQKTMTTQLASWAELRHDFMLYAKQPYSSGMGCSFPDFYVEPVPDLYHSISDMCSYLLSVPLIDQLEDAKFLLNTFRTVSDTLWLVAKRELNNEPLSNEQSSFLRNLLVDMPGCVDQFKGWYIKLYNKYYIQPNSYSEEYTVADYHTAPTDESGNMVGWVCHAGPGPVNLATVIVKSADGKSKAYIGPVSSYYELTTTNFKRLSDLDWYYAQKANSVSRPLFSKLYLSDSSGMSYSNYSMLFTKPVGVVEPNELKSIEATAYPNPFSNNCVLEYMISDNNSSAATEISICNTSGEPIRLLLNQYLQPGAYATQWDGRDSNGNKVPSGMYIARISSGATSISLKLELLR